MHDNKPINWRDHLPVHPAADLFPPMSDAELRELGEDIKKNRLSHRIVLWRDQETLEEFVLDGRNRLDAMDRIGLVIDINKHFEWQLSTKTDPYEYVISANIHRRHLTAELKHDLIAKLLKMAPEKSDRAIAKQAKTHHHAVAKVRQEEEGRGNISHVEARTDTKGRKQPAKKPIQPKKSTSSDSSRSGVSQVSTAPEKLTSGLPTGSTSARIPVPQTKSVKAQDISNVAYRLIQFDIHLAQELYRILWDDDHIQQLRGDLITGIKLEAEETGSDDGLAIPDYPKRAAP